MKIKICGLFRPEDALMVNEFPPDYAGFILHFPRSRRHVTCGQAAEIRGLLRPEIGAVGVFVDRPPEEVASAAEQLSLDAVQLHGSEDEDYIAALRRLISLPVWKAFVVRSADDADRALRSSADEILLDGGMGQGRGFDLSLTEGFGRPFILAGGLTPESIPGAARIPGVIMADLSSGVETGGVKDREKIRAAVSAARNAR